MTTTRMWRIYGSGGYRIHESFFKSRKLNYSRLGFISVIEIFNSDVTGTNQYTDVRIQCYTPEECERELLDLLQYGVLRKSRIGEIIEIDENSHPEVLLYDLENEKA